MCILGEGDAKLPPGGVGEICLSVPLEERNGLSIQHTGQALLCGSGVAQAYEAPPSCKSTGESQWPS